MWIATSKNELINGDLIASLQVQPDGNHYEARVYFEGGYDTSVIGGCTKERAFSIIRLLAEWTQTLDTPLLDLRGMDWDAAIQEAGLKE